MVFMRLKLLNDSSLLNEDFLCDFGTGGVFCCYCAVLFFFLLFFFPSCLQCSGLCTSLTLSLRKTLQFCVLEVELLRLLSMATGQHGSAVALCSRLIPYNLACFK